MSNNLIGYSPRVVCLSVSDHLRHEQCNVTYSNGYLSFTYRVREPGTPVSAHFIVCSTRSLYMAFTSSISARSSSTCSLFSPSISSVV